MGGERPTTIPRASASGWPSNLVNARLRSLPARTRWELARELVRRFRLQSAIYADPAFHDLLRENYPAETVQGYLDHIRRLRLDRPLGRFIWSYARMLRTPVQYFRTLRHWRRLGAAVKFSIVIPTQDRAKLLSVAVDHAMRLEHPDFEVIVSDNSTMAEKRAMNQVAVREHVDAPNFRVVHPPQVLSPPAHFEFALEHARGDYVAYLTDKMAVFPNALSDIDAVIEASGADIVNWACAEYFLEDPESPLGSGILVEEFEFLNGQP